MNRATIAVVLIGLGVFAVLRAPADIVNAHVLSYYVINYSDGLIRRGLVGEVFSWFVPQNDLSKVKSSLLAAHAPMVVGLLAILAAWHQMLEGRRRDFLLSSLCAVFLASQFVPTLAFDVGYLDVYDFLLVAAAAIALAHRQAWVAVLAGAVGPFVHEAFVFYWLPLLIVGLWEERSWRRGAVLAIPFLSTILVYIGASQEVAAAQILVSALTEADKQQALVLQFGQTLLASLQILSIKYRNYLTNAIMALAFFALPAAVIIGLSRRRGVEAVVLLLASLAPLLILAVGWDLSRFLTGAIFSALIAVFYMETVRPVPQATWRPVAAGWAAAALLVQVPFTYAYFEVAAVRDVGPRFDPVRRWVEGAAALYSRAVVPAISDRSGNDPLPAGNVWYVEEDVWEGAWIRRPGTNIFDAVMTLPVGLVETYKVTVERVGDTIVARRNVDTRDRMDYVGTLKGKVISGKYSGGYWFARITCPMSSCDGQGDRE